jgi:hypothetical protein
MTRITWRLKYEKATKNTAKYRETREGGINSLWVPKDLLPEGAPAFMVLTLEAEEGAELHKVEGTAP